MNGIIRKYLAAGMLAGSILATPALAQTTLLQLIDPPGQANTPYVFTFTATDAVTEISFAGYQVPAVWVASDIGFYLNDAGPNLLGMTWTYTPAPSGALAGQYDDGYGTGTNGLQFAGVTEGSYDVFSQSVATTTGASYSLHFLFSNYEPAPAPTGVLVTTSATAAVPEPASWAMLTLGFGALGASMRYRRRATAVSFA